MDTLAPPAPVLRKAGINACYVEWYLGFYTIRLDADRLTAHSDGRLGCRLRIAVTADVETTRLYHAQVNLSSGQTRRQIARALEDEYPLGEGNPPWTQILEQSAQAILDALDQEEPVHDLAPLEEIAATETRYVLKPLVVEAMPTILYAPGGSAKSFAALTVALLAQNGIPLDSATPCKPVNALYLDYEADFETMRARGTRLIRGLERCGWGKITRWPLYRFSTKPLAEQVNELARVMVERQIGLLVVDSIALAAGGDLYTPETAIALFRALREVTAPTRAATLFTGHTSKEDRRSEDKVRLIYGSVFFENLARSAWELRTSEGASKDSLNLSFFCRKSNAGPQESFGLELLFGPEAILVRRAEVIEAPNEYGVLTQMILDELAAGPTSTKDLIEALGEPPGTVRRMLTWLKKRGKVENVTRGMWRLAGGGNE